MTRFQRRRTPVERRYLRDQLISIVSDAAIGTRNIGDGRLIPVVILDTTSRPDLEEFIRVHKHFPPGDVISQWATIEGGSKRIALLLDLKKPMDMRAVIEFDPERLGGLIDQIINTKALYMQAGKPGDKFKETIDAPKVLVEIPETGFAPVWDEIYYDAVVRRMRKQGIKKKQARQAAKEYISQFRKFGSVRIGSKS